MKCERCGGQGGVPEEVRVSDGRTLYHFNWTRICPECFGSGRSE